MLDDLDLPPGFDQQRCETLSRVWCPREPACRLGLDYKVGVEGWCAGLDEASHDRRRSVVRDVGEDLVVSPREPEVEEIAAEQHDVGGVGKVRAERAQQEFVDLDGDDVAAAAGELASQRSPTRAHLDNEIAGRDR